jgi:uncharacterized damage-inducible protein DinB
MTPPRALAAFLICLLPATALAQVEAAAAPESPVTTSLAAIHGMMSGNILATAEMLDDEMYAYQPTDDVRTTGQMLAHIAGAQYAFCSAAAGEENPNTENLEETATTKAELVPALEAAFAYCQGVYDAMTDEEGATLRSFFGNQMAASAILAFNTTHNYEHYGNLVTYMRMNGIVPPSSQQ